MSTATLLYTLAILVLCLQRGTFVIASSLKKWSACWRHCLWANSGKRWRRWLRQCGATAFHKTECQEYLLGDQDGRCIRLTILPSPCADCLEMLELRPSGTPRACPGLYKEGLTVMTGHQDRVHATAVLWSRDIWVPVVARRLTDRF
jgi:hypothetical protein